MAAIYRFLAQIFGALTVVMAAILLAGSVSGCSKANPPPTPPADCMNGRGTGSITCPVGGDSCAGKAEKNCDTTDTLSRCKCTSTGSFVDPCPCKDPAA